MSRLRDRFVERSRADRVALSTAFDADDRGELRRLAHSLSGAGGLFGFPQISARAAELEHAVDRNEPRDRLLDHLRALLDEIDSCN